MSTGAGSGDPQQAVIDKVKDAKDALKTAVEKLEDAVRKDADGAKKGGRELRILAEQVLDVRLQATVLQDRLETEKTTPEQEQADRERDEQEKAKRGKANPVAGD